MYDIDRIKEILMTFTKCSTNTDCTQVKVIIPFFPFFLEVKIYETELRSKQEIMYLRQVET